MTNDLMSQMMKGEVLLKMGKRPETGLKEEIRLHQGQRAKGTEV